MEDNAPIGRLAGIATIAMVVGIGGFLTQPASARLQPVAEEAPASSEQAPEARQEAGEEAPEEKKTDRLKPLKDEIERLRTEQQLQQVRLQAELADMETERQRLEKRKQLEDIRRETALAELKEEASRLRAQQELRRARFEARLAEQMLTMEQAKFESDRRAAEMKRELQGLREEAARLQAKNQVAQAEMAAAETRFGKMSTRLNARLFDLQQQLKLRSTRDELDATVTEPIEYATNPWDGHTLVVSDRRIALNGPIITGTAAYVADRIHFYNNQSSELPIFIVIDNSPGGSVMQGYRIMEAMDSSEAPVYVVVKSFAASMAAVITTIADESFALPNAILLHHQMSGGSFGNLTEQNEQIEVFKEWERRLHVPVAERMGVSLEEFRRMMYENSVSGDWREFADVAQRLKWVGHVVGDLQEQGIRNKPTGSAPTPFFFFFNQKDELSFDREGNPFYRLPPLPPFDMYWMYDPQDMYR